MNYRHAFHAGNFADVMKHALLVRILLYLRQKPAPYRVIDTHAGEGGYDLTRDEAARTGEWREGVGRLYAMDANSPAGQLLAPYLDLLGPRDNLGMPTLYPGSPLIAQALLREHDRALFCELHPASFAALSQRFRRGARVKAIALDGWNALQAFVPPPERRGLVLVDPPFEEPQEFARMADGFARAWRKWPTGIYALWYPVKNVPARDAFMAALRAADIPNLLQLELGIAPVLEGERLSRAGLVIANPPYVLEQEAKILLPALSQILSQSAGPQAPAIAWVAPPR